MTRVDLLACEMEEAWQGLRRRLSGLTDAEFFWQPVAGCWTVRPTPQGRWAVDYADSPPEPPPFTTIGWRVLHLASCKVMYHEHAFGAGKRTWDDLPIPHTAASAIEWLEQAHARLATALSGLRDSDLDVDRPTNWGEMWPTWRILWTMVFHDVHHGAEIGCLRRLFAARPDQPVTESMA